jgi:threonine/homoserine/homoserine lactone efflux protein
MHKYIRPWFWGFICSFLGSLPLGSLNSLTIQIKYNEGFINGLQFALGIAISEIIHVSVTLFSLKWILKNKKVFNALQWLTIAVFLFMAFGCFYSLLYPSKSGNVILEGNVNRFILGFSLSVVDLMPIPFWLLWTTIFISKKRLNANPVDYRWYAFGICIGTLSCQICYMFIGSLLLDTFNAGSNHINVIVGTVLLISASIQLFKKIKGKNVLDKLEQQQPQN